MLDKRSVYNPWTLEDENEHPTCLLEWWCIEAFFKTNKNKVEFYLATKNSIEEFILSILKEQKEKHNKECKECRERANDHCASILAEQEKELQKCIKMWNKNDVSAWINYGKKRGYTDFLIESELKEQEEKFAKMVGEMIGKEKCCLNSFNTEPNCGYCRYCYYNDKRQEIINIAKQNGIKWE